MKIHVLGRKMWMDFFFGGNPDSNILETKSMADVELVVKGDIWPGHMVSEIYLFNVWYPDI